MANIRISKKDKAEYARLTKNAKAKMRRLEKNNGIDLQGEIELPPLSAFSTRKQFNEWKENASSFTNRNNYNYKVIKTKQGVPLLGKEIREYKEAEAKAIKLAEEHYKKVTPASGIIFKKPTRYDIPKKLDFNEIKTRTYFKERLEKMKKRSRPDYFRERDIIFKENFIASIEGSFNSTSLSRKVIEQLKGIDPDYFYEIYKENFRYFNFELYDSEGQMVSANEGHLKKIHHILKEYEDGRMEFPLKDFPDKV